MENSLRRLSSPTPFNGMRYRRRITHSNISVRLKLQYPLYYASRLFFLPPYYTRQKECGIVEETTRNNMTLTLKIQQSTVLCITGLFPSSTSYTKKFMQAAERTLHKKTQPEQKIYYQHHVRISLPQIPVASVVFLSCCHWCFLAVGVWRGEGGTGGRRGGRNGGAGRRVGEGQSKTLHPHAVAEARPVRKWKAPRKSFIIATCRAWTRVDQRRKVFTRPSAHHSRPLTGPSRRPALLCTS